MKLVAIESPFGSSDPAVVRRNVAYARLCLRDCLERGEAPYASHLLYPQPEVLDDQDPSERALGINAGLAWGDEAELKVVYTDLGTTKGMRLGIDHSESIGQGIEYRQLPKHLMDRLEKMASVPIGTIWL